MEAWSVCNGVGAGSSEDIILVETECFFGAVKLSGSIIHAEIGGVPNRGQDSGSRLCNLTDVDDTGESSCSSVHSIPFLLPLYVVPVRLDRFKDGHNRYLRI